MPDELKDAVDLTSELGPLPAPHLVGSFGYQLEADMRLLEEKGDDMISLQHETRERLENGVPRWIIAAVMLRADFHGGHGAYVRKFHQHPFDAGDVRQLLDWWMNVRRGQ